MKTPPRVPVGLPILLSLALAGLPAAAQEQPELESLTRNPDQSITVVGSVPAGYQNALLEVLHGDAVSTQWMPHVSGPLNGGRSTITFSLPDPGGRCIVRLQVGDSAAVPPAPLSGLEYMIPSYGEGGTYVAPASQVTHLLNRIAYGPSVGDYATVEAMGVPSYIMQQLNPASIDETGNPALNSQTAELFHSYLPNTGTPMVRRGDVARFFRGVSEPPTNWKNVGFNDSGWETGPTGIGYGDGDDATELTDMQNANGNPGYLSYFVRLPFSLTAGDIAALEENLVLNITYDDAFVAYLNGTEVARMNVNGSPPAYNMTAITSAGNVDGNAPGSFELNAFKGLLLEGDNVLAVQVHNQSLTSSDASMNAELVSVEGTPYPAIRGVRELQHLMHVRGVYSKRQLQAVLGEFWENHFTTEFPKVEDYLLNRNEFEAIANQSSEAASRINLQAELEALSMEYAEYEFFHENALGNFGDLLLYSATSPAMLIYLDNILNKKEAPNENYAREILELHGFGVDNRYTQGDIEELAKCFTGWSVRKIHPEDAQGFPGSARTPPTADSIEVGSETELLAIGETWKYFKGTGEPSGGAASTDWAHPGFDDSNTAVWLSGPSGFGYSDNDDNTVLTDMQQKTGQTGYISVFLRKEIVIPAPSAYDKLFLDIDYDDGFVAYLNGTEIGRSSTMNGKGSPPPFSATSGGHEAGQGNSVVIDLAQVMVEHPTLLNAGGSNTLAIQAHNASLTNGDFSILPRLRAQTFTTQSIAVTNPRGIWAFRFDPNEHDRGPKTIFAGTPYQIQIPEATDPNETGLDDAIDVIDAMISHPSTSEFICLKLVNRFVSDEITLGSYHDRSAPDYLLTAVDRAIAAWNSTSPKGNIGTVMTSILDPAQRISAFWLEGANRGKVKNPVEFVNSSFRALDADIASASLPVRTTGMGMFLFTRPEPDGFSEEGNAWMDTQSLLQRMKFAQGLGLNQSYSYGAWDAGAWMTANGLTTPEEVVDHLNTYIFGGTLTNERKAVFVGYANTDDNGSSSSYANLSATNKITRMRQTIGLILSAPEFQYQ